MSPRKNFSSGKSRDDKPKRAFKGKKSFGDKPAFKKQYPGESSFYKDKDEKGSFRNPAGRDSRPDDRERKPFVRPEGRSGDDRRRSGSKPPVRSSRNPRWEARPDWKKKDDAGSPRGRNTRPDDRERKPFRRPDNKFGDERPSFEGRERTREDRPERASRDDVRPARAPYSRDARPDSRERKPFNKSEGNFGKGRRDDDSRPTYRDRKPEDDARPGRAPYSSDSRSEDGERKPFRRSENKFGDRRRDDSRPSSEGRDRKSGDDSRPTERSFGRGRAPFDRDARPGEGEKKWNRKSDSEFYGDRRKSAPRGKGFGKKSFTPAAKEDDGLTRLNKFISNAGICSRREADEMIEAGVVSVNGEVMTQLGYKVKPEDVVKYNNEVLKSEKMVYLLLNKPKDFITTADDPEKRKTVMGLIDKACKERVYPVGRLDRNTTGLLIMTNDGDLTRKLTHPSFEVQKIYQVELDRALKSSDMEAIESGVQLNDGFIKVDAISYVGTGQDKAVLGVEIHSGKNRIVRRIFEHVGYEVKKLDRVYFAGLSKKDLPRGRWRFLSEMEVASLKIMTGSKKFKNLAPVEEKQELE